MLKNVDRGFGWLMILASIGHTFGTVKWTPFMSGIFVWSLGSSLAGRPEDKTLAAIAVGGTFGCALLALAFGKSIGDMLDPRVVGNVVIAVVLVGFGVRTFRRTGGRA